MKWVREHKGWSVFLVLTALYFKQGVHNENAWSLWLGLVGWIIPIAQIYWRNKNKKGLGRFAPVVSMGACCLSIWFQLYHYLDNIMDLSHGDIATAVGVWKIALFLLVTTILLNLILAGSEKDIDTKLEEDHDLTI